MTTTAPILTFSTRPAAQAHIDELDAATYHLGHGEHSRPSYTARKTRGGNTYYIHVSYGYYSGTFYAKKNGPLLDY